MQTQGKFGLMLAWSKWHLLALIATPQVVLALRVRTKTHAQLMTVALDFYPQHRLVENLRATAAARIE
jgi:hypothetical protein